MSPCGRVMSPFGRAMSLLQNHIFGFIWKISKNIPPQKKTLFRKTFFSSKRQKFSTILKVQVFIYIYYRERENESEREREEKKNTYIIGLYDVHQFAGFGKKRIDLPCNINWIPKESDS